MYMIELNKNLNITKPDDVSAIDDIVFTFQEGKYANSVYVENIISFDTESSNGFLLAGTQMVVGLDQDMYDRGIIKIHNTRREDIDPDDPDVNYVKLIDAATPVGLMYMWQVAIEDGKGGIKTFLGRTFDDLLAFQIKLNREIKRQYIYGFDSVDRDDEYDTLDDYKVKPHTYWFVHNLGHDFEFLLNLYNDKFSHSRRKGGNVFARKARKPFKANMWLEGVSIQYTDTLVYSQKSLKNWAHDCPNCPLEKLDDFDYLTIKTPYDELTPEEIHYGLNDVLIIVYCMAAERDAYKGVENLPLTQTGKVRRVLHKTVCKPRPDWAVNCAMMTKGYTLEEYQKRIALYQGGYTHACSLHIGDVLDHCVCFDFASSYPSALTTSKYACFGYEPCSIDEFKELEKQDVENPEYRWFMKVRFTDINSVMSHDYWSASKCEELEGFCLDNGRVYSARVMTVWMLDLDWYTFKQAYDWESMEVLEVQKGAAGYLPKEMIETVLDYYSKKTSLKGTGRDSEYTESKEFINSVYGCFCYKQVAPQVAFDPMGWETTKVEDEDMFNMLIKQVSEENSFGFFDLGMTCSAIARKRIWDFILHFDDKVWYIDTDSIKGDFNDDDIDWVNNYNKWVEDVENRVAREVGFDPDLYCPVTAKGKKKRLGIMEREEDCSFKTLGAKRYVAKHGDSMDCTIAGLPKWAGKAKIKTFDDFNDNTLWTTKESGKVCCYYNDNQPENIHWTGRNGKVYISDDKFGVCLKPVTFDLSLSGEFVKFLGLLANGVIDKEDPYFDDTPAILKPHR